MEHPAWCQCCLCDDARGRHPLVPDPLPFSAGISGRSDIPDPRPYPMRGSDTPTRYYPRADGSWEADPPARSSILGALLSVWASRP